MRRNSITLARLIPLLLVAAPAGADPDLSIFTLNAWQGWSAAEQQSGVMLASIDDLPTAGAGGPDVLALQEATIPLVGASLLDKGYFLTAEPAAASIPGKLTATRTPPHHAAGSNRFGGACGLVCDILESCTIADGNPICILNVHSQEWQHSDLPGNAFDAYREALSTTLVARARALARGGFRVFVVGDFNAGVERESIQILERAGFDDAWMSIPGHLECSSQASGGCTLVDNPIEDSVGAGAGLIPPLPDHRRIDHLYAYGGSAGDDWDHASVRFDGGAGGPRVSGQNGVLGIHGGTGAFAAVTPEGEYDVSLACTSGCTGVYAHRMSVDRFDPTTGAFSGTGFYAGDPTIRWTVAGTTDGATFELTYDYLPPNAGFQGNASGGVDGTGAPAGGTGSSPTHALAYAWSAVRRAPAPGGGSLQVDMTTCDADACPGSTQRHRVVIQTWNPATGAFTGLGYLEANPAVHWTAVGTIRGTRFDLTFTYRGANAGYQGTVVGSIDADGILRFGLGRDNATPTGRFDWQAIAVPEPDPAGAHFTGLLLLAWRARRDRR